MGLAKVFTIAFWVFLLNACDQEAAVVETAPELAGQLAKELPEEFTVNGSLSLDPGATAEAVADGLNLAERPVALTDEAGNIIAKGSTSPSGTFALAIGSDATTAGLRLAGGSNLPSVLKIKSLFEADPNQDSDALGVQQTITIDPYRLTETDDGSVGVAIGDFGVKKVGAIVGTLTLETGESPVGIEVYIPGTSYIAKADANGKYILGFLPKGTYTVRAEKDGFSSLEWADTKVGSEETVHLGAAQMRIAKGPQITEFHVEEQQDAATQVALQPSVQLKARITGANRVRISQLSDFRDATYRPLHPGQLVYQFPFQLTGADGVKTVYLEAADSAVCL